MYRILFIEDEKILGQLIKEGLQKEGYDTLHLTNGSTAIQSFRDYAPHLCLLDVMLPDKDGYTIARQIRALDKQVPIIFLTAKVQVKDLSAGFEAGCNDYIRKPFNMEELLIRIKTWLAEKHGKQQEENITNASIGNYKFFPDKQELHTPDGIITMTHKDAIILHLLYTNKNNVVSRDHIMQKVWGEYNAYTSRTLDVYINRIRKYFKNTPNQIITLKGVGYRFICE